MPLSDLEILHALDNRDVMVTPLLTPIQPASIDLRLGYQLLIPEPHLLDLYGEHELVAPTHSVEFRSYTLEPGQSVLGSTLENIVMGPKYVGILTGKSKLARVFLQVECAGYIDPGFLGCPTIEMTNLGPYTLVLRPEMPICQLRLERITGDVQRHYGDPALGSHYGDKNTGPRPGIFSPRPTRPNPASPQSGGAESGS